MKLSNLSIIFIIFMLPIMLIVSYYVSMQIDTINMQTAYNSKLLTSTKSAVEAFEINTVEWNESYSSVANSKRRDVMASVNTFLTSFANSIGTAGISKEDVLAYVPAILTTLYDGYYIYTPSETMETIKNQDGSDIAMSKSIKDKLIGCNDSFIEKNSGKLLYKCESSSYTYNGQAFTLDPSKASKTYSHMLKPFSTYSARYKKDNTDIVVSYTLDNYITISGVVKGKYIIKSGYLTTSVNAPLDWDNYGEKLESLSENVYYKYNGGIYCKMHTYVYDTDNIKVYFDGDTPFTVSATGERTNLSETQRVRYKKVYVGGSVGTLTYQALNAGITNGKEIKQGVLYTDTNGNKYDTPILETIELKKDYSVRNYGMESWEFTGWVYNNLKDITIGDIQDVEDKSIYGNLNDKIFDTKENNNPDDRGSIFVRHKNEIIKQTLISNLEQAITGYSRNSAGNYELPILTDEDWDQILRNVSIVTFVQGIPIGMKYYNNYVVATSTANKEFVNPDEIYINDNSSYYHMPYCDKISKNDSYEAYRNIDYIARYYNDNNDKTVQYYKHKKDSVSSQECYYCLVQRNLYNKTNDEDKLKKIKEAYTSALYRERYVTHKFETYDEENELENQKEKDKNKFNAQFLPYEGIITGDKAKELASVVQNSNSKNADHQVLYIADGSATTSLAGIDPSRKYNVIIHYADSNTIHTPSAGYVLVGVNGSPSSGLLVTFNGSSTEPGYIDWIALDSTPQTLSKDEFNAQFEPYKGNITGAKVKELIEKVNKNNLSDSKHQVWVYSTILLDDMNDSKSYRVTFNYTGDNLGLEYTGRSRSGISID